MDAEILAGLWTRDVNYEPRDVVADSSERDGSVVLWMQAPNGLFADFRRIKSEEYVPRAFAGSITVEATDDRSAWVVTWNRWRDSKPASCPTGIDSATVRRCGPNLLLEEGDGYLEIWRRIAQWDSTCFVSPTQHPTDEKDPRFTIQMTSQVWELTPNQLDVKCSASGLELCCSVPF